MNNYFVLKSVLFPLSNHLAKINWNQIGDNVISNFAKIVFITLIFWLINWFGKKILETNFQKHNLLTKPTPRSKTAFEIIKNLLKYAVMFFYAYTILSIIGVPIGTLVAGAGILSVTIGLGTQGLVSDFINGLTILMEGQLRVGDSVTIQNIDGTVISIGLRTVVLKASDGTIHYLPNRFISTISNHSMENQTISIFLRFENVYQIDQAKQILKAALVDVNTWSKHIVSSATIKAPFIEKKHEYLGIQISVKVKAGYQADMKTLVLGKVLKALANEQIKIKN